MGNCNNLFPFCITLNALWRKFFRNHADSGIACHFKCNLPIGFIPNKYRLYVVPGIFGVRWSIHYLCSIDYRFQANHNGTIPILAMGQLYFLPIYILVSGTMCALGGLIMRNCRKGSQISKT